MPAASPKDRHSATGPNAGFVVSKAGIRAAAMLGINHTILARVLGLSPATVTRLHAENYALNPDSKPYELALLLIRLFRGLDALMGGEEPAIRSWMQAPNLALGNTPLALITSVTGLVDTVAYVDSARARV